MLRVSAKMKSKAEAKSESKGEVDYYNQYSGHRSLGLKDYLVRGRCHSQH